MTPKLDLGNTRQIDAVSSPPRALGIRAKLFIAFCTLTGLTIIACVVAWLIFATIDRSVTHVTRDSVPGMVNALALAKTVTEISAIAPTIMSSTGQQDLADQEDDIERLIAQFRDISAALDASGHGDVGDDQIGDVANLLAAQLGKLAAAVDRRLDVTHQRKNLAIAVQNAHARFSETLEPYIDDAVFDLVITGENVMSENSTALTSLVEEGVSEIDHLLSINAAANLAAGLMAEALNATDPVAIEPVRERFLSAALAIERSLAQLPSNADTNALHRACDALLAFGRGRGNLFDDRVSALRTGQPIANDTSEINRLLKSTHERLLLLLTPLIDDAAFSLVMTSEDVTARSDQAISGLIEGSVNTLSLLLTVRAEGNLIASLLSDAGVAANESLMLPLEDRFAATASRVDRLLQQLDASGLDSRISAVAQALLELGRSNSGMFDLRRQELHETTLGQAALDSGRTLSIQLNESVGEIVARAEAESNRASQNSASAIGTGQVVMALITIAGLVGALVVMFRYIDPRIIRPLGHITSAMTRLSHGDTSVDIPGRDRNDELGRMAQALGVFRDTAIAVQEANVREIQTTRRRLADAIESISEGFSLYDGDDRLVVSNAQYQQLLYPDMTDKIQPGMTFESILRQAVAEGYVKDAEGQPEIWIAERLARHRNPGAPHVQQRGDGRYIMVSERQTEESGIVAVYSDITQLKQRETELAQKSKELEQLAGQLAKYLSPQVYESIFTGRQEVKVESQRKKLTVFFSDIADFTATTEKLESEDLTVLLNQYLTEMSKIALSYGATIDKYVGDAIVIFFGDPETKGVQQDAIDCVEMSIAMRQKMEELRSGWRNSGIEKPLECRMGINTGYCTVGNFGSEARMDYTIIGAGVNLASRLESSATPGDILISYETYAWVKDRVMCEARDPMTVKGISRPVATYRVVDTFDKLGRHSDVVREEHPNLRLDMNPAAMSDEERNEAKAALRQALGQLTDGTPPEESGSI